MKPEKLDQLKKQHPDLIFESVDGNVIVKEKPKGRWRAGKGVIYWYINSTGDISLELEQCDKFDDYRYQTGNYFKSEREAEAYKERLITRQRVLDRLNELKEQGYNAHIIFEDSATYCKLKEQFTHDEIKTLII